MITNEVKELINRFMSSPKNDPAPESELVVLIEKQKDIADDILDTLKISNGMCLFKACYFMSVKEILEDIETKPPTPKGFITFVYTSYHTALCMNNRGNILEYNDQNGMVIGEYRDFNEWFYEELDTYNLEEN